MDRNLLRKGGSSDPLVTLELGGEKRSSTCKPKCLAPTWQEGFVLPAEDGASVCGVCGDAPENPAVASCCA